MEPGPREALAAELAEYDSLVEVGIGRRTGVAGALAARGRRITATDVHPREVPDGVAFVLDDVTDPDPSVYANAGAIYALNCPPELHRPIRDLARRVDADFLFTTLGGDGPAIPVSRRTLPAETLFVAER
ncbi:UPF0146 family protein [Halalkalicoccus sp. NIPERK01]|uniref:UPF0146 family protein n=1 Tax=Halalkalicoccus sp. NIPERK01 TaxID=3053469 RepID=UPI00256EFC03|nr:UPF0146 family protein [Halalkalicoccus sp. NIPERK01]MDL5361783.1 UPF0146 family protein [Halalkalicoccus sp. NIPERK01]